MSKTDSSGTYGFKRNGAGVTDPVLSDGAATYTPGISERRAGSSKFLHSGMKNTDAQSGASANVDSSRTYDAFGNLTGSSGSWSGPFGYAGGFGYQEDPDHGLRLLGHRYYDSSTGRFISKDPIGDGRNWTAYGAGEAAPTHIVDPDGQAWWIVAIPIVARALPLLRRAVRLAPRHTPKKAPLPKGPSKPASAPSSGPRVHADKQGKHQVGHKRHVPGRSELTHKDPQGLVNKFAGKGQPANNVPKGRAGYRERVDFGEVIGFVRVEGKMVPTTKGIIHYADDGSVHIVPALP